MKWLRRCMPPPRNAGAELRIADLEARLAASEERRRDAHAALAVVVHACGGRVAVNFYHFAEMQPSSYGVAVNFDARTNSQVFTTTPFGSRSR